MREGQGKRANGKGKEGKRESKREGERELGQKWTSETEMYNHRANSDMLMCKIHNP